MYVPGFEEYSFFEKDLCLIHRREGDHSEGAMGVGVVGVGFGHLFTDWIGRDQDEDL